MISEDVSKGFTVNVTLEPEFGNSTEVLLSENKDQSSPCRENREQNSKGRKRALLGNEEMLVLSIGCAVQIGTHRTDREQDG